MFGEIWERSGAGLVSHPPAMLTHCRARSSTSLSLSPPSQRHPNNTAQSRFRGFLGAAIARPLGSSCLSRTARFHNSSGPPHEDARSAINPHGPVRGFAMAGSLGRGPPAEKAGARFLELPAADWQSPSFPPEPRQPPAGRERIALWHASAAVYLLPIPGRS
jgi:hypothetical protein